MMRFTAPTAVLALTAAACAAGPVGEPIAPDLLSGAMAVPPVHALVGHRADLELTSDQVAALDSIGDHLHRANAPLERELRDMPRRSAAQPEPHRPRSRDRYGTPSRGTQARVVGFSDPERAREILTAMRENNRDAEEGVRGVLTESQVERVCPIFEPRTDARRSGVRQRPSPWSWCRAAEEDEPGPQNGL